MALNDALAELNRLLSERSPESAPWWESMKEEGSE
jgi:hypothetical protein